MSADQARGQDAPSVTDTPAKVLVVDDTPHNVKLLADLLGVKGYAVCDRGERRGGARQGRRRRRRTWCCST